MQPSTPMLAKTRKAPVSPPVVRFKKPIKLGPTNPPVDPMALITAMAAAAPVPRNNIDGRHQNDGRNTALPSGIIAKDRIRNSGVGANAALMHPTDITVNPTAVNLQRSSRLSDRVAADRYTA